MISRMFLYRLGHCADLSIAEFEFTTQNKLNVSSDNKNGMSAQSINVNQLGSIVWRANILKKYNQMPDKTEVLQQIQKLLQTKSLTKLGLNIKVDKNIAIAELKKSGVKKVNIIFSELKFGHFKAVKNWIELIRFDDELLLVHIDDFSNQEFWSSLDTYLPSNDMRRGIINLKLARSLLNLTTNKNIWDPFAGTGRLGIGGIDLKSNFIFTDIDELGSQINQNIEYTQKYFGRNQKYLGTSQQLANYEFYIQDVLDPLDFGLKTLIEQAEPSIVTEGTLGFNFTHKPDDQECKNNFSKVLSIWSHTLHKLDELKIREVIFCVPWYPKNFAIKKSYYEQAISDLATKTDYELNIKPIYYSRKTSNVGHLIIKLQKSNNLNSK